MRLDRVRHQPIVGVKEDHILAFARTKAGIARPGQTLVFLMHAFDPRITPHHLSNVVWRTVVHDYDFSLGIRLRQYALDRFRQKMRLVVTGNDHRYKRFFALACF